MDELVINVMNTPVKAIESEFPVRIERYELAADSAGPGKFRGGLGTRRQWRIVVEESAINLRTDRFKFASAGVFGAAVRKGAPFWSKTTIRSIATLVFSR